MKRRPTALLAGALCVGALLYGALLARAEVVQTGTLRVTVAGKLRPERLPRRGRAPIAVTVSGRVSTADASLPPQLRRLRIELNRHGHLDSTGLPTCSYEEIQPGSRTHALTTCREALVGTGSFTANITLADQDPIPTTGPLTVFNGRTDGKPVLFGHIFAPRPFATSFVIVFAIHRLGKGRYGTLLDAPLPKAMDAWGRLTDLKMTLSRRYRAGGARRDFLSSGCPTPSGVSVASFPLARTSFLFVGGKQLSAAITTTCRARP